MSSSDTPVDSVSPLSPAWLDPHWMPFTGNRQFKANPRMFVAAEGAYLIDQHGKRVFDGLSGLWCTGLGHCRKEIVEAVQKQVATLDYSPAFQFGHPGSFALATRSRRSRRRASTTSSSPARDRRPPIRRSRSRVPTGAPRAAPRKYV